MKEKMSALALIVAVLPALVFAYPGFGGGRGLLRVQNALVEDEAGLTVSLHGVARSAELATDTNGWAFDLVAPELSYAPVANKYVGLEVFGSWGAQFQYPVSPLYSGVWAWGLHDLKAGGKLSVPIIPVLKLGGTASYTFKGRESGDDSLKRDADWVVLDPEAFPYDAGKKLAWSGLVTIQLQDVLPSAPNLVLNYGKVGSETQYAAAVELQGKGFGLFVEWVSLQRGSGTDIFGTDSGHIHLTPGVVLGDPNLSFLKLGYTFSSGKMNDVKEPDEIILGFGFATPFGKRMPTQYGTISGRVTDEKTGAALAANVAFPENAKIAAFATEATGVFEVKKIKTGVTVVEVSADGYNKQVVPLAVEDGKVVNYEFKLRPLKAYGTIAGTVVDAVTSAPMAARVEFPGSQIQPTNSDAAAGAFKVDKVEVGVYTLTASADKYIPATITLAVEDGKLATATFKLAPTATGVAVTGRVSDKKTDSSLAATVTFNDAVSNTDPATGVYKTQLMPGSYTVVVESKDYVKQTVALIVEKDKPLVRDFAMLKVGMSITLRGIYFDFDKSTIKPESRPALEDAAKMLKENPTINVEIQGHTDSKGSDSYNLSLSDRRAASVVAYLVTNLGIDASRLTSKGYGESMPIATNDTDAGRALNRRVEFKILGEK